MVKDLVPQQSFDVLPSLPKRRNVYLDNLGLKQEVLAESAARDGASQVRIGCADDEALEPAAVNEEAA
jgi:hypothetical protein